jgi:hypothetical protein
MCEYYGFINKWGVNADAVRLQTMVEATIRSEIPDPLKRIELQSKELKGFEKPTG